MKKIFIFLFSVIGLANNMDAQKITGTVKGTLQEAASAQPLPDATVSVMAAKDSSLISFTLTYNIHSISSTSSKTTATKHTHHISNSKTNVVRVI